MLVKKFENFDEEVFDKPVEKMENAKLEKAKECLEGIGLHNKQINFILNYINLGYKDMDAKLCSKDGKEVELKDLLK